MLTGRRRTSSSVRAGAQVLQRQVDAQVAQLHAGIEMGARPGAQLQGQRHRRGLRRVEGALHRPREAGAGELLGRHVHVQRQRLHPREAQVPRAQLA